MSIGRCVVVRMMPNSLLLFKIWIRSWWNIIPSDSNRTSDRKNNLEGILTLDSDPDASLTKTVPWDWNPSRDEMVFQGMAKRSGWKTWQRIFSISFSKWTDCQWRHLHEISSFKDQILYIILWVWCWLLQNFNFVDNGNNQLCICRLFWISSCNLSWDWVDEKRQKETIDIRFRCFCSLTRYFLIKGCLGFEIEA